MPASVRFSGKLSALLLSGLLLITSTTVSANALTAYGDYARWGLPAAAAYIAWQKGDTEGLWMLGKGFATSSVTTLGLKEAVGRERPDGSGDDSFPSGHTTNAFAGAAFLQQRYGWRYGLPAYAAASLVGYSRLQADKHHLGDVVAGAAIGIGASYLFTAPFEDNSVMLFPVVAGDSLGLHLTKSW